MKYWIAIEDGSGNKLGSGPITSATAWDFAPALSRAGSFAFSMPAADPKAALIVKHRVVHCFSLDTSTGSVQERGVGVINHIEFEAGQPDMIHVSGSDLARELTYRVVPSLVQIDESQLSAGIYQVAEFDGTYFSDLPNAYDDDGGTYETVTLDNSNPDFLYIGFDTIEAAIYFDLSQANSNGGTLRGTYWIGNAWVNLPIEDYTNNFSSSGKVEWQPQPDWAVGGVLGGGGAKYWIRLYTLTTTSALQIDEVYIVEQSAVSTDIDSIMDEAPAGWSLETATWYDSTEDGSYLELADESVLAMLVKTAEMSGEHFRVVGREVQWMRTDTPDSGVVAIGGVVFDPVAVEGNVNVALITSLRAVEDSYEELSRVYPYGAGNGTARVTLEHCTESAPSGYTLSTASNYIEKTSASPEIHRVVYFDEVRFIGHSADAHEMGSNQLYRAALAHLRANEVPTFYELSVVKLDQQLLPGDTIRVIYRGVVDGSVYKEIDADLIVLSPALRIDASGLRTVKLLVATVNRMPASDDEVLARELDRVASRSGYPQPQAESQLVVGA